MTKNNSDKSNSKNNKKTNFALPDIKSEQKSSQLVIKQGSNSVPSQKDLEKNKNHADRLSSLSNSLENGDFLVLARNTVRDSLSSDTQSDLPLPSKGNHSLVGRVQPGSQAKNTMY